MKPYVHVVLISCLLFLASSDNPCSAKDTSVKQKVILLGADGLTESVIEQLLAQGKLKHIQYLRKNGSYGRIVSIEPTVSPALWTSIVTGKNRGEHGILDFQIEDKQTGRMIVANSSHRKTKALWNILSENQLTVGSVGYFSTWPAEIVNGFMISDTSVGPKERGVYPSKISDIMKGIMAPYTSCDLTLKCDFSPFDFEEEQAVSHFTPQMFGYLDQLGSELINNYLELITKRTYSQIESDQYRYFLKHNELIRRTLWFYFFDQMKFGYAKKTYDSNIDLFILYLEGSDAVSHFAWEYYDPNPDTPQAEIAAFKDIIPNYYFFVDQVLGYFLQVADPDTTIILVSDHGFEKKTKLLYDINKILNTMGYLDYGPDSEVKQEKIYDDNTFRWTRHLEFRRLYVNLNNIYPNRDTSQDEAKIKQIVGQLTSISVGKLKLFEKIMYYPGKHPAANKSIISQDLKISPGIYSIEAVINRNFYAPEFQSSFRPDDSMIINHRSYPLKHYFELASMGEHSTNDGVVHFIGPVIKTKNLAQGISILDITPAILKILDLPIGADMAGKVPSSIFKPEFLAQHPTRYIKSYDETDKPLTRSIPQAPPEESQLKQQLRSLGYIQ